MSENEIAEKQIVCEGKTVGNPAQASVAKIEIATVVQEVRTFALNDVFKRQRQKEFDSIRILQFLFKEFGTGFLVLDIHTTEIIKSELCFIFYQESSLELPQADPEGTKGSDNQISRELEPIENEEITSSPVKEHVPIDLQDKLAEASEKAEVEDVKEVYPKEAEVGHGRDKIIDKSSEEITKKSTSVEDSTEVSDASWTWVWELILYGPSKFIKKI